MGLDIFFPEDIRNTLTALAQSNQRAMTLAERYGMNLEAARLCGDVYAGALADVGAVFGLALPEPTGAALAEPDTLTVEARMNTIGCIPETRGQKRTQKDK